MIPIFAIFCKEFAKACFFAIPILYESDYSFFLIILSISQLITSPIQGGVSDYYCRRKSLLFSICAVVFAQSLLLIGVVSSHSYLAYGCLLASVLLDGWLGNVSTVARAAMIDSNYLGSARKALGYSFAFMGLPWILVFSTNSSMAFLVIISVFLNIASLVWVYLKFSDKKDVFIKQRTTSIKHDLMSFTKIFNSPSFCFGILAFFLSEIGFESMFLYESEIVKEHAVLFVYPLFGLGFTFGALFQNLVEVPQKNMKGLILLGFAVSCFSIFMNPLFSYFQGDRTDSLNFTLSWTQGVSILSATSGFYFPTLFALFSKNHQIHEQGKVFGFLESILNMAEVFVAISFFVLNKMVTQNKIIAASSVMFFLAFLIFKFLFNEKIERKN